MSFASSEHSPSVGVVAALAAEARQLGPAARGGDGLSERPGAARVAVTGIGSAAAAEGARRLVAAGCRSLASFGLAGALDPSLAAGAIVLPEEVVLAGGASLRTADEWRARAVRALEALDRPVACGKLLTSARALGSVAGKASAFAASGAVAVDMESFAVAQVAAASGLPFIAVRAIVDTAEDEVPPALATAADEAGELSVGRILGRLAVHPSGVAALVRLAARYRAAIRALRAVAAAGVLTAYRA